MKIWKKLCSICKLQFYGHNSTHIVMLSVSFLYLYRRFSISSKIYDIINHIHHHLQVRGKGKFNCSLLFIVYDDSIGITIEDTSSMSTFLLDTFPIIWQYFIVYLALFIKLWQTLRTSLDVTHFLLKNIKNVCIVVIQWI